MRILAVRSGSRVAGGGGWLACSIADPVGLPGYLGGMDWMGGDSWANT